MLKTLLAAGIALVLALSSATTSRAGPGLEALSLDQLFARLHDAPNALAANEIASEIWLRWTTPEDKNLSKLMKKAMLARQNLDVTLAMNTLDQIVRDFPDYAEGWNQRATLHYILGNYEDSLADIAETLKREPRHFGALSGQAMIYLKLGRRTEALQAITRALSYHPFLTKRQLFPQLLKPVTRT